MSLDDVKQAIVRAGASSGWVMTGEKPGNLVGTYRERHHTAVVDIKYTTRSYSISHKDSEPGLKHDGETIHQQYNVWNRDLERRIRAQISAI